MTTDFGRIAIGTRNGGPVSVGFFECWTRFIVSGTREGDEIMAPAVRKPAHLAANLLARAFLDGKCDTLLYVDDDHAFTADTLERLRSRPENWAYDCVGALYIARGVGRPLILTETPESQMRPDGAAGDYFWPTTWEPGAVMPVDGLGLGFTLIRRHVLEALDDPAAPWFYYPPDELTTSEDLPFFRKVRRRGFTCAVDTAVPIGHIIDHMVHGMPPEYEAQVAEKLGRNGAAKPSAKG